MEKLKVLLVDDEPDFIELMGMRIRDWGYELTKASSGKEAISRYKEKKPDIIVLDYMMPEMDGIATLKQIRSLDKQVPVIMFTAYPATKVMDEAEKLGVSSFVPKLSAYTDVAMSLRASIDMLARRISGK